MRNKRPSPEPIELDETTSKKPRETKPGDSATVTTSEGTALVEADQTSTETPKAGPEVGEPKEEDEGKQEALANEVNRKAMKSSRCWA